MTDLSTARHLQAAAGPRPVRAPRGSQISCANWLIEAAYRMIQNNLDPEVAENPDALVVYGGIGKAARNWAECFRCKILDRRSSQMQAGRDAPHPESGKPVGVFRTHEERAAGAAGQFQPGAELGDLGTLLRARPPRA